MQSIYFILSLFITVFCASLYLIYMQFPTTNTVGPAYTDIPDYNFFEFPNFLSPEECDHIIAKAQPNLFVSKVYSNTDDVFAENTRQSKQCWLDDSDSFVKDLTYRIKDATNTHNKHAEHLQVVNYQTGGFFTPHYDACDGDSSFCERMNGKLGPRLWTFLIYLNDDFIGGETLFPNIDKSVKPEKGKAVLFKNVDDNGAIIRQAFHGGNPVLSGEKWIANKWIRM